MYLQKQKLFFIFLILKKYTYFILFSLQFFHLIFPFPTQQFVGGKVTFRRVFIHLLWSLTLKQGNDNNKNVSNTC